MEAYFSWLASFYRILNRQGQRSIRGGSNLGKLWVFLKNGIFELGTIALLVCSRNKFSFLQLWRLLLCWCWRFDPWDPSHHQPCLPRPLRHRGWMPALQLHVRYFSVVARTTCGHIGGRRFHLLTAPSLGQREHSQVISNFTPSPSTMDKITDLTDFHIFAEKKTQVFFNTNKWCHNFTPPAPPPPPEQSKLYPPSKKLDRCPCCRDI